MTYNIVDFGAVSDGKTVNTEAINRAVEACAKDGGGTVVVPAGEFLSGTIRLYSHVELHIEHGAVLKASGDFADYNADDAYKQNFGVPDEEWTGAHFIYAVECEDIAVTGSGTIDGNGSAFVSEKDQHHLEWYDARPYHYVWFMGFWRAIRPGQTISLVECRHVRVEGITLRNLPSWCLFLHGCDCAQIRGVSVYNPPAVANTDGIDIDSCRYVTVSDCLIDTGDDAIAIRASARRLSDPKRNCEHIAVTNCVLGSCSSVFRIGVGLSEVRHVRVSGITAFRGHALINFCTEYGATSRTPLRDINFSDMSGTGISTPLVIESGRGIEVEDATIENIRCEAKQAVKIVTAVKGSFRNIALRNVDIRLVDEPETVTDAIVRERGEYVVECRGTDNLTLDGVRVYGGDSVKAKWTGMLRVEDCDGFEKRNCRL